MEHRELTEKIIDCAYRVLMAIFLCIAVLAGSGFVRGQESGVRGQESGVRGQESGVRSQESGIRSQESGVRNSAEEKFEYFKDFIVYIKKGDFHHRILVCDVVVELNRGMKLPQERIELRKIIYNTLKKPFKIPPSTLYQNGVSGDFHPLDLHKIRRSLKEEIKIILNNFMGDETIKNVYFPKSILL